MKKYTFKNTDDYFKKMSDEMGILKKVGEFNINNYQIEKSQGEGYIKRLKFGKGIEIIIGDFRLNKALQYEYKLKIEKGVEIIYFLKGWTKFRDYSLTDEIEINENEIRYWDGGINNQGWMKYPQNIDIFFVNIYFNKSFIKEILFQEDRELEKIIFKDTNRCLTKKIEIPELIVPFKQIIQGSGDFDSPAKILYLQSKAVEIISYFIEDQFLAANKKENTINKTEDIKKIKEAKKIMASNLIDPFSINELSKKVGLNNYKLKVGFNEIYNTTPFSCLRSLRMEKAKEFLIQENGSNIMEIANRVGYSNSSHFAAAFKKEYGLNPSVFRRKISF